MSPKLTFLIIVLLVIASIVFYIIRVEAYPGLLVNGHLIRYGDARTDWNIALHYYDMINQAETNITGTAYKASSHEEIEAAVLDTLVQTALINKELSKRIGESDLENMIQRKIDESLKGDNLEAKVQALYGLSLDAFKERVLKPQAETEILESRMILENTSSTSVDGGFSNWLREERVRARVIILLPGFSWNGKEVVISK